MPVQRDHPIAENLHPLRQILGQRRINQLASGSGGEVMGRAARVDETQDEGLHRLVEAQFDLARRLLQGRSLAGRGGQQNRMGESGASEGQPRQNGQKPEDAHCPCGFAGRSFRPGAGAFRSWALAPSAGISIHRSAPVSQSCTAGK